MKNYLISKFDYPAPEIEIIKLGAAGPDFSREFQELDKLEGEEETFVQNTP